MSHRLALAAGGSLELNISNGNNSSYKDLIAAIFVVRAPMDLEIDDLEENNQYSTTRGMRAGFHTALVFSGFGLKVLKRQVQTNLPVSHR